VYSRSGNEFFLVVRPVNRFQFVSLSKNEKQSCKHRNAVCVCEFIHHSCIIKQYVLTSACTSTLPVTPASIYTYSWNVAW